MHRLSAPIFVLIAWLMACPVHAQRYEYVYRDTADSTVNCYLKVIPGQHPIKALVVRDYTELPDTSQVSPYRFTQLCTQAGIMTLYTCTSRQFPELFTTEAPMRLLDEMIVEVVNAHQIPLENIFIGGMSASGTRALRYAQYCAQGKSLIRIRGVFSVDSPLDLERFYQSAHQHRDNFLAGMRWEADHMIPLFENLFGGSPEQLPHTYHNASVYTQSLEDGGNARWLINTSVIMFHEPDIDWWLHERGAAYFDINSFDMAALAQALIRLGHKDLQLVTTTGKGFDRGGNRNCHSWSIVDENQLLDWIVSRIASS